MAHLSLPHTGAASHSTLSQLTSQNDSHSSHEQSTLSDSQSPMPPPPPPSSSKDKGDAQRPHPSGPSTVTKETEGLEKAGEGSLRSTETGSVDASKPVEMQDRRTLSSQLHVTIPTAATAAQSSTTIAGSGRSRPVEPPLPDISITSPSEEAFPLPTPTRTPTSPPRPAETFPRDNSGSPGLISGTERRVSPPLINTEHHSHPLLTSDAEHSGHRLQRPPTEREVKTQVSERSVQSAVQPTAHQSTLHAAPSRGSDITLVSED